MRRVIVVAPLLGAVLLAFAGCAGDEPSDDGASSQGSGVSSTESIPTTAGADVSEVPTAGPVAMAKSYSMSARVERSDIDGNKSGEKYEPRVLDLACEDSACSSLLQRVEGSTAFSGTVQLAGTDRLTGVHTRTGTCPEGGDYSESFTWAWTQRGLDLSGRMVQNFKGCDLDGTTVNKLKAIFKGEPPVDALPDEESKELATALDDYDAILSGVYDAYAACLDPERTDEGGSQPCIADTFAKLRPAATSLAGTLDDISIVATGVCEESLRENRLQDLVDSLRQSAKPNATGEGRNATANLSGDVHEWLTNATRWCLPVEELSTMSEPYSFDIGAQLPPSDGR